MLVLADLEQSDSAYKVDHGRTSTSSDKAIGHFSITVTQLVHGTASGINQDQNNATEATNSSVNWKQNGDFSPTIECTRAGSSVTKAIVVIDTDLADLSISDKICLLKRTAKQLKIDPFSIIVRPVINLKLLANAALVAGKGNAEPSRSRIEMKSFESKENDYPQKEQTWSESSTNDVLQLDFSPDVYASFQWVVGCGDVQSRHMEVLADLEKTASNSQLSASLGGLGIIGWYVVNNKPPRSKRSPSGRQKYGQFRGGRHFEVDFSSNNAHDIYAASGDGYVFPGMQTEAPEAVDNLPVTTTTKRPHRSSKKPRTKKPKSTPPITRQPINVYVGRPFSYDLSNEAIFWNGAKDYGISSKNSDSLPPNFWIKINTTSPKLYGFPLEDAIGPHEFKVSTMTRSGVDSVSIRVNVLDDKTTSRPSHQFCMTLDQGYERFIYEVESRIEVATKLAHAFHSTNPEEMTVVAISGGSVVYTWFNNSLPQEYCDEEALLDLMNGFVDSNGEINEDFKKALEPYQLINASVSTFGPCSNIPPRPTITDGLVPDSGVKKDKINSDKLLYMIIGLIVAAAIILVIIFVALLLLCRHKRKQKHEKQKQLFKSGMPSKGVPVIFAEELQAAEKEEDKKSQRGEEGLPDTARSTLRSRKGSDDGNLSYDKRGGVPPPEYQPPRPGNRDALKNDMIPILEGFPTSNKSPYSNEDNSHNDSKDPLSDNNHNIENYVRSGNFRWADPRLRQENRKNQQMIVSEID